MVMMHGDDAWCVFSLSRSCVHPPSRGCSVLFRLCPVADRSLHAENDGGVFNFFLAFTDVIPRLFFFFFRYRATLTPTTTLTNTGQVRVLQQADDDATLTQLVIAWVHLAQGGKRYQEASYIFDELIDKFQVSSKKELPTPPKTQKIR